MPGGGFIRLLDKSFKNLLDLAGDHILALELLQHLLTAKRDRLLHVRDEVFAFLVNANRFVSAWPRTICLLSASYWVMHIVHSGMNGDLWRLPLYCFIVKEVLAWTWLIFVASRRSLTSRHVNFPVSFSGRLQIKV